MTVYYHAIFFFFATDGKIKREETVKEEILPHTVTTLDRPKEEDEGPPVPAIPGHTEPAVYENLGFVTEKIPMTSLKEVYQRLLETENGLKQEHSVSIHSYFLLCSVNYN